MEFLARYTLRPEPRYDGRPGVGEIEFQTPYEQVVLRSFEHRTTGYSAQQAQTDYAAQPQLIVRAFLFPGSATSGTTNLYSDSQGRIRDRRENFWREFKLHVTQEVQIQPDSVQAEPVYSPRGKGLQGAILRVQFDAARFAPRKTRIEIATPDGQPVVAEFPLNELR